MTTPREIEEAEAEVSAGSFVFRLGRAVAAWWKARPEEQAAQAAKEVADAEATVASVDAARKPRSRKRRV